MSLKAPYRYDIVGSFLRTQAIKTAREKFAAGTITAQELTAVEDQEIRGLVGKEEKVGLHAVTDGGYRRSFWHMDVLWGLTGTQKVKAEHFSVAFKGFQPKAETVKIVDKLDFPDNHPFLAHFKFLHNIADNDGVQAKQCIPSPSMLHLICCVREPNYQPIDRYKDEQVLLDDLAAAYQKAVRAFYAAGCRGNFRSTWSSSGGYEPVAEILFAHCPVDGFFLEYDSDRAGGFEPLRYIQKQKVVLGLVTSKEAALEKKEDVIARIHEAAKYVPLDQLALSPQCGFASTEEGNLLTDEDQWKKLALVKEIANQVWGQN